MIPRRRWIATIVAAGFWMFPILAQEPGSTPSPPSATGDTAPAGTTDTGPLPTPPAPAPPTDTGATGAASSFQTTPSTGDTGGFGATGGGEPATGSGLPPSGLGFGAPKAPESAPSFTLPGFYGSAATSYTAGAGRLARPRFRYSASLAIGYDDNVLQTPDKRGPDQFLFVDPGTPDHVEPVFETRTRIGQGGIPEQVQVVVGFRRVKGTPPKFVKLPAQGRSGSLLARTGVAFDMQLYSRRSLFTFDANVNADHYFSRPTPKDTDYNGGVALSYLYRFSPRTQVTAQVNAVYLTQPDFSRINTPQALNVGAYINANARLDLSYRWTPRFTSVVTLSDNSLLFQEKSQQSADYNETLFGTELRYLWTPRFTALGELRYSATDYPNTVALASHTAYFLLGAEFRWTQRISGGLRMGSSVRTYDEGGDSASTPYAEMNLAYRLNPGALVNWNMRFGFEEPFAPGDQRTVLRSGLSFIQAFSARTSGAVSINYLHETDKTAGTQLQSTSDLFDATVRLEYNINRHFSVNASSVFTQRNTSSGVIDYHRTQFFLGGQYSY